MRDGINIARFTMKLRTDGDFGEREAIHLAIQQTLGEEAMRYARVI